MNHYINRTQASFLLCLDCRLSYVNLHKSINQGAISVIIKNDDSGTLPFSATLDCGEITSLRYFLGQRSLVKALLKPTYQMLYVSASLCTFGKANLCSINPMPHKISTNIWLPHLFNEQFKFINIDEKRRHSVKY
jgi:hypothetical protein